MQVPIDPSLQQQLESGNPVALCDVNGKILGHFLPEEQYQEWLRACYDLPLADDELARRREEDARKTLSEIWKGLGRL